MEHIPKCVGGGEGIDGLCELVAVAVVFRGVAVGGGDLGGPGGGGGRGTSVADMISDPEWRGCKVVKEVRGLLREAK